MKRLILFLVLTFSIVAAQAQIPADVVDVMSRCRTAMTNPAGLEYEMDIKTGMGPLSMKMHIVSAEKGNLHRMKLTMKFMGVDIVSESGFDGTNTWEVKQSDPRDTITITSGDKSKKGDKELSFDLDKQYNKAKMKLKDGYYEITFSEPKDKSSKVKSVTVKISEKNYTMRELKTTASGVKATMTVTKIRVGLKDNYFKLHMSKYPDAVVIKE